MVTQTQMRKVEVRLKHGVRQTNNSWHMIFTIFTHADDALLSATLLFHLCRVLLKMY